MNLTDLIWLIGLGPGRPASLFFGLALQAMGRKADPKKREEYFFSSVTQGGLPPMLPWAGRPGLFSFRPSRALGL